MSWKKEDIRGIIPILQTDEEGRSNIASARKSLQVTILDWRGDNDLVDVRKTGIDTFPLARPQ
jgi:hypothetical protein